MHKAEVSVTQPVPISAERTLICHNVSHGSELKVLHVESAYVCMYVCMYVCLCVCVCVYVCMICVYVCMCVFLYV